MIICKRVTEVETGELLEFIPDSPHHQAAHKYGVNPMKRLRVTSRPSQNTAGGILEAIHVCGTAECRLPNARIGAHEQWFIGMRRDMRRIRG